ncbi:hypothetical protein Pla22_50080 [Rubripirellula amarantea]|uniref:Right handed beta helix domain-containing protein n=1 Tax=Rubripirellula amarantea TaxID=2527999 RepID=A0A5C5WAX2_9BACT|nr:right-handed parallel beta-helix repeat-containing protein [Rubripirellula amarantea]TWT48008.1 hypothetical protein Pla22_50080 [Rubripirellula amarantea]
MMNQLESTSHPNSTTLAKLSRHSVLITVFAIIVSVINVVYSETASGDQGSKNTIWLTPNGDDANSGKSVTNGVASGKRAAELASPGSRIVVAEGRYSPLRFEGLKGSESAPILIEAQNRSEGSESGTVVSSGNFKGGTGLTLVKCQHVILSGFEVTKTQKGIGVHSCSHCIIKDNWLHDLGQEAIHVGRGPTNSGDNPFTGPESHHVRVANNKISSTGKSIAIYGEGIYIGTGAIRGDHSHDIVVEDNVLTDISAEAIELKPGTYNLIVRGNKISNTHHEYNAAITVCVEGTTSNNGNYLIENNVIRDIKKVRYGVAGIAIGHGNAIIRNNQISDIDGGIGIQVYRRFQNEDALKVELTNNTVRANGVGDSITLHYGNCGLKDSPLKANVSLRDNQTDDASAGTVVHTQSTPK